MDGRVIARSSEAELTYGCDLPRVPWCWAPDLGHHNRRLLPRGPPVQLVARERLPRAVGRIEAAHLRSDDVGESGGIPRRKRQVDGTNSVAEGAQVNVDPVRALTLPPVDLVTRMAQCHATPPLAVRRVHAAGDQARR